MSASGSFVFDTNAFISCWRHHHSPDVFPLLWEGIAGALDASRIMAPRQVLDELDLGGDDLARWAADRRHQFPEPNLEVQAEVGRVLSVAPPSWGSGSTQNSADPWVVAMALTTGATVATYEGVAFSGAPSAHARQNMLWVCGQLSVRCVNPLVAFRELGLGGGG